MVLFVEVLRGCLPLSRDWGCSVTISICVSRGKICTTGSQFCDTNSWSPGETAVDSRHEGRRLLVADRDESDLFRLPERIGDSESLLAWNLKDKFYLFVLKASH